GGPLVRRGTAAGGAGPGAGAAAGSAAAGRAHQRPRHRPPAAGAGPGGVAAHRRGHHGGGGDARPDAGRTLRSAHGDDGRRAARGRRPARRGPRARPDRRGLRRARRSAASTRDGRGAAGGDGGAGAVSHGSDGLVGAGGALGGAGGGPGGGLGDLGGEAVLLGSGGADGWPNPFCRCASCRAAERAGVVRGQTSALVDGRLLLDCGPEPPPAAVRAGRTLADVRHVLLTHAHPDHLGPAALLYRQWAYAREPLDVVGPPDAVEQCRPWSGPDDPVRFTAVEAGDEIVLGGGTGAD